MNERFSVTEPFSAPETVKERIPTVDSFGDIDEALAWIFDRMIEKNPNIDDLRMWWHSEWVSSTWVLDPDAVIRFVCEYESKAV